MTLSTHVLDTSVGKPASGVGLRLFVEENDDWKQIGQGTTDADGRCKGFAPDPLAAGVYRLVFKTGEYFAGKGTKTFYPKVAVHFEIADAGAHYHVPLLVSPWGYSTYRGS
jgi:5-hydroxyisourate hydrolase